jgi:histidinol-phosphate aminotransferase
VLRTFSKSFSLAGMRIGLAFASEEIISGMMKVKDSYNLNRLSLVAPPPPCGYALDDAQYQADSEKSQAAQCRTEENGLLRLSVAC